MHYHPYLQNWINPMSLNNTHCTCKCTLVIIMHSKISLYILSRVFQLEWNGTGKKIILKNNHWKHIYFPPHTFFCCCCKSSPCFHSLLPFCLAPVLRQVRFTEPSQWFFCEKTQYVCFCIYSCFLITSLYKCIQTTTAGNSHLDCSLQKQLMIWVPPTM